jgi:hypothetical protein
MKTPFGIRLSKVNLSLLITNVFWYIALFPGRLGFDNALALDMIRNGDSTDWWTGTFWRILQVTTFQGHTIAILSGIQLVLLAVSFNYLINSLPNLNIDIAKKSQIILSLTPIYGFFALSISHDVFQCSALLLMTGYVARLRQNLPITYFEEIVLLLTITFSISTVKTGVFFILLLMLAIFRFSSNQTSKLFLVLGVSSLLTFVSPLGLDSSWSQSGKFTPFLGDMKCIVQHPDAQVKAKTWQYLEGISPRHKWLSPTTCTGLESAVETLEPNFASLSFNMEFLTHYTLLVSSNPEIFVMGHIVRSREALPPLLFPPPENQVSFDFSVPLGNGTNAELQNGPPLLHPSIDSHLLDQRILILKPLEVLVQLPAFLVNQASWFWGWAGLWYVIAMVALAKSRALGNTSNLVYVMSPVTFLHLIVVAIGFNPQGRHLMISILLGVYFGIYSLSKFFAPSSKGS